MTPDQRFKERVANAMRERDMQLLHALDRLCAAEAELEQAQARIAELTNEQPN